MQDNPMAILVGIVLVAVLVLLMFGVSNFDGCSRGNWFGTGSRTVDQSFR